MSSYWQPPSWSVIPPSSQKWHLDELKNGHLISTHSLNSLLAAASSTTKRRCLTFGRVNDPAQIDIVTAHESCSRLHARLAFASNGVPYLKDLGSGNGTFVNNRRLPPEACGKSEYTNESSRRGEVEVRGSRGVVVYPGDAIRFGCSTRLFVLEGPEAFERGATVAGAVVVLANNDNEEKKTILNNNVVQKKEEQVCSWGILSSAEYSEEQTMNEETNLTNSNSNHQQPPPHHHLNLPPIETFFNTPSKYTATNALLQLYNQYQSKLYKHDAISTESKRISQKEDMGVELTDGQRNQLMKNNDKLIALEGALKGLREKIEEGMYVAIYGKPMSRSSVSGGGGGGRDEYDRVGGGGGEVDVDDFYDRTASSKRQRDGDSAGEAESEASLVQQWKMLIQSHSKQQTLISSTLKQCSVLHSQIDNTQDEEEVFFLQNDLNLVNDNVEKATQRLDEIEQELKDVERLLKIVNPKLNWDRDEGLIGTDLQIHVKRTKDCASENNSNGSKKEEVKSDVMMPPPPKTVATSMDMPPPQPIVTNATNETNVSSFKNMMPPPPKVTMSEPESSSNSFTSGHEATTEHHVNSIQKEEMVKSSPPPSTKKRQLGPMRPPPSSAIGAPQGTLAALQQFTSHSNSTANNNDLRVKKQKTSNNGMSTTTFDPRKDEWNAPTDQDGSGRTSLHDKFKGRY